MNKIYDNTWELLDRTSKNLNEEELQLATLQGLIAAEISMKRQDMDMNQKQFADFMGVSQGLVSKWEAGTANFTLHTLVKIAIKLDLPLQSPIIPSPMLNYTGGGVIVPITDAPRWKSAKSTTSSYEKSEPEELEELKEM